MPPKQLLPNRVGFCSGFADPRKNHNGHFKNPPEPVPKIARVTTPMRAAGGPPPARNADGTFHFPDFPYFKPNLSPEEIFRRGSFGGTYFRPIYSVAVNQVLTDQHQEFPAAWFRGLDAATRLTSSEYHKEYNFYGVACGGSLDMWESSGWINPCDPLGWLQWFARFFLGRRCLDDSRQVKRWESLAGPKGRFRNTLINMLSKKNKRFDDASVSPVIRQTLQHWGYVLTAADAGQPQNAAVILPKKAGGKLGPKKAEGNQKGGAGGVAAKPAGKKTNKK